MKNQLRSHDIQSIMDEWSKAADTTEMFFNIAEDVVYVYTTSPGRLIGKGGERINSYTFLLKQKGAKDVKLVDVHAARIPEIKYGMEICPLPTGGSCYDHERLGEIACGICKANEELAAAGQVMVLNGIHKVHQEIMEAAEKDGYVEPIKHTCGSPGPHICVPCKMGNHWPSQLD